MFGITGGEERQKGAIAWSSSLLLRSPVHTCCKLEIGYFYLFSGVGMGGGAEAPPYF